MAFVNLGNDKFELTSEDWNGGDMYTLRLRRVYPEEDGKWEEEGKWDDKYVPRTWICGKRTEAPPDQCFEADLPMVLALFFISVMKRKVAYSSENSFADSFEMQHHAIRFLYGPIILMFADSSQISQATQSGRMLNVRAEKESYGYQSDQKIDTIQLQKSTGPNVLVKSRTESVPSPLALEPPLASEPSLALEPSLVPEPEPMVFRVLPVEPEPVLAKSRQLQQSQRTESVPSPSAPEPEVLAKSLKTEPLQQSKQLQKSTLLESLAKSNQQRQLAMATSVKAEQEQKSALMEILAKSNQQRQLAMATSVKAEQEQKSDLMEILAMATSVKAEQEQKSDLMEILAMATSVKAEQEQKSSGPTPLERSNQLQQRTQLQQSSGPVPLERSNQLQQQTQLQQSSGPVPLERSNQLQQQTQLQQSSGPLEKSKNQFACSTGPILVEELEKSNQFVKSSGPVPTELVASDTLPKSLRFRMSSREQPKEQRDMPEAENHNFDGHREQLERMIESSNKEMQLSIQQSLVDQMDEFRGRFNKLEKMLGSEEKDTQVALQRSAVDQVDRLEKRIDKVEFMLTNMNVSYPVKLGDN